MRSIRLNGGRPGRAYLLLAMVIALAGSTPATWGQSAEKNTNPYVPSPAGNARPPAGGRYLSETASVAAPVSEDKHQGVRPIVLPSIAEHKPAPLTEIYRVGPGDVIQIKIRRAASGTTYNTVRADGTIDFPLAGEDVMVAGFTTDEISAKLASSIKLFADAKVDVAVREYASHPVTIGGNVKIPGPINLRREAVPLFVLKAGAMVENEVNVVKITKAGGEPQTYRLRDVATDGILIGPGTTLEFRVENLGPQSRYFVATTNTKSEERPLAPGLTLSKVAASESANARKANIHRQDKKGIFVVREFDLRSIRAGKSADPPIEAGDIIQIKD